MTQHAQFRPNHLAFVFNDTRHPVAELSQRVNRMVTVLLKEFSAQPVLQTLASEGVTSILREIRH